MRMSQLESEKKNELVRFRIQNGIKSREKTSLIENESVKKSESEHKIEITKYMSLGD